MSPSWAFTALFVIVFGAFALTEGHQGRIGGDGVSFRALVIDSPRLRQIKSLRRRDRAATAVVYATYGLTSALLTGLAAVAGHLAELGG